jgi:CRP-like cAMP-binding protein
MGWFARRSDERLSRLARFPLFVECPWSEVVHLGRVVEEVPVAPGAQLMLEDQRVGFFHAVAEGLVGLSRRGEPTGMAGPGTWFGEAAILGRRPAGETARTLAPSTIFVISARELDSLVDLMPGVRRRLIGSMAGAACGRDVLTSDRPAHRRLLPDLSDLPELPDLPGWSLATGG